MTACACGGTGVRRENPHLKRSPGRWVKCDCGRMPDSRGVRKLLEQKALDERLETLKHKGW